MKADLLREKFLDYFKAKKHKIVESDSLVPEDDPTVLFTPAGMNQFKKEFLGFNSGFSRAATAQRCLRTDDLEKVGKTSGHHTFFEMLGNFSFGDYFKKEAIIYAWEFLTEILKIEKDRLWVSVYKDDDEAYKIWSEIIGVPEKKIIKLGDRENFWPSEAKQKGPNGPCGPCSEIFFDQGPDVGCRQPVCDPSCECDRFLEVWNLVFTQFNRKEGGKLEPLPKKNIDTGMGLERLAALMQGVPNNFQTDLFGPMIKEINSYCSSPADEKLIFAIADHARAVVFSISDGVMPSNEERGYVIRKLIRRSLLHLMALGIKEPFLFKLVPVLSGIMKKPYPQLQERKENIAEIILAEEEGFIATLNSSNGLFKEKFSKKQNPQEVGRIAFQLYDTYGIPFELTNSWLDKEGISISREAFDKALEWQRGRSKAKSAMKGDVFDDQALDYNAAATIFSGYKDYSTRAKILKLITDNKEEKKIEKGKKAMVILDQSVFYPESGGQAGDTGELIKGKNVFLVEDTQKVGKLILHIGRVKEGAFSKSDFITAKINTQRRLSIARNHTATHILQAALRKILGKHVRQQGSLVAEDRLRFDFTHFKNLDKQQLIRIEEVVNEQIFNNCKVKSSQKPLQQAKKLGALAFFKERYDQKVRVVSIGDVSLEFCGGTHLESTGQIGLFKIIDERSIASGIRRIEAVTGTFAYKKIREEAETVAEVSSFLNVPADKIMDDLGKKTAYIKELEKRLNLQEIDSLKTSLDELIKEAAVIKDMRVITKVIDGLDANLLRKNVDLLKEKSLKTIIALGSKLDHRALLVMGITQDLCDIGLDASSLIRQIAAVIGGSGGGRKDFAQAGGSNPAKFQEAFEKLKAILSS